MTPTTTRTVTMIDVSRRRASTISRACRARWSSSFSLRCCRSVLFIVTVRSHHYTLARRVERPGPRSSDGAVARSVAAEEVGDERADAIGLFLLHPMPGAVDELDAADHAGARARLHPLERAGILIGAPVGLSGNEHRRLIDRAAGEQLQFRRESAARTDAVRLEAALKSRSAVLGAVHAQLIFGKPLAGGDRRSRRHLGSDGLGHAFVAIHDVIARQPGPLFRRPRAERMRIVLFPVGALHVVVGPQERMQPLRRVPQVVVRLARRVVTLIV